MNNLESTTSIGPSATLTSDGPELGVPLLQMRGITKSFFGVPVLDAVDLDVMPGEVHAVVGENGAGKSTLMKILVGAYQPDAGSILLDGEEVHFGHPRQAQERGVSIIYQEFNLLPERTVAQNIFLGREPARGPLVDNRAMEQATARLLAELGVEGAISPGSPVRELSVAQQQTVEIAKALSFEARILVMDEPTAALSPHEVDALFERVRLQVRGGAVGKLHDIDLEVRSGEIVGLAGLAGAGRTEVARALFGVEPFTVGAVELNGKPVRIRSPRQAIRAGIGFLTEDRKLEGLVLPQSVRDNALLALRSLGQARMSERPVNGKDQEAPSV